MNAGCMVWSFGTPKKNKHHGLLPGIYLQPARNEGIEFVKGRNDFIPIV